MRLLVLLFALVGHLALLRTLLTLAHKIDMPEKLFWLVVLVHFSLAAALPDDNVIQLAFSLPGTVSDVEVKRFMDLAEAGVTAVGASSPSTTFDCAGADETTCAPE